MVDFCRFLAILGLVFSCFFFLAAVMLVKNWLLLPSSGCFLIAWMANNAAEAIKNRG